MSDDGYIAVVCGDVQQWAHWNTREAMEAAAKEHLQERLWDHYKHLKELTEDSMDRIVKEVDFRVYRIGEESYRVAVPWRDWIRSWWSYKKLLADIESVEEELEAERVRISNYLDEWVSDADSGGVQAFDSDMVLDAHRQFKRLSQRLSELGAEEEQH